MDRKMTTYHFESVIDERGVIVLPDAMRQLKRHRGRLVITDLEDKNDEPIDLLDTITSKYLGINENEIDSVKIYKQRERNDERRVLFD